MNEQTNGNAPVTRQEVEAIVRVHTERVIELVLRLNQEIDRRFEAVDRRFDAMQRQIDRLAEAQVAMQHQLGALNNQMAAMNKWADRFDRDSQQVLNTQTAQQRAIDDLAARVTKLESRQQ